MNKVLGFWIACSVVLFLLSLLYLHNNLHRKNAVFAWWLCVGVSMQLVSAYGLVLGCPPWLRRVWSVADLISFALALGVLAVAFQRRSCPVNQILLYGIGSMVLLNLASRWCSHCLTSNQRAWLVNIAFFGPAIFLLLMFSNVRIDRLPLYLRTLFRVVSTTSKDYQNATARSAICSR